LLAISKGIIPLPVKAEEVLAPAQDSGLNGLPFPIRPSPIVILAGGILPISSNKASYRFTESLYGAIPLDAVGKLSGFLDTFIGIFTFLILSIVNDIL
jgi:hypothetical protein